MENKTQTAIARLAIISLAIAGNFLADDSEKMYLSAFFISFALVSSLFVFKRTFPFFFLALLSYWFAVMHEVWGGFYNYTNFTRYLWSFGNVMMGIGMAELAIHAIFKKHRDEEVL